MHPAVELKPSRAYLVVPLSKHFQKAFFVEERVWEFSVWNRSREAEEGWRDHDAESPKQRKEVH